MRPPTVHICPICKKTSIENGPFERIAYGNESVLIDGFRYCSVECRLKNDEDAFELETNFQLKRINHRNENFRRDKLH